MNTVKVLELKIFQFRNKEQLCFKIILIPLFARRIYTDAFRKKLHTCQPYLIGTVPILTQEKGEKNSYLAICPNFCKNLSIKVMYRKFRNVPIFKDFPPICRYFLGFRVGKYEIVNLSIKSCIIAMNSTFS